MNRLLRFSDLKERRIVENWARIRRLQEQSDFPAGFLLSPQCRVWDEAEVEAWLEKRRTATPSPPPSEEPSPMSAPQKITELWAWICTEEDGGEGIPACQGRSGVMLPLVGADAERIRSLRPWAEDVAKELGLPVKLVRFHQLEVIETLEPATLGKQGD